MVSSISRRHGDKSVLVTYDGFKRWLSSAKSGVFSAAVKQSGKKRELLLQTFYTYPSSVCAPLAYADVRVAADAAVMAFWKW